MIKNIKYLVIMAVAVFGGLITAASFDCREDFDCFIGKAENKEEAEFRFETIMEFGVGKKDLTYLWSFDQKQEGEYAYKAILIEESLFYFEQNDDEIEEAKRQGLSQGEIEGFILQAEDQVQTMNNSESESPANISCSFLEKDLSQFISDIKEYKSAEKYSYDTFKSAECGFSKSSPKKIDKKTDQDSSSSSENFKASAKNESVKTLSSTGVNSFFQEIVVFLRGIINNIF